MDHEVYCYGNQRQSSAKILQLVYLRSGG